VSGETKGDALNYLPYEKFETYGAEALSDHELLAIIIRTGTKSKTALMIASEILNLRIGENNLLNLYHLSLEELMGVSGIGRVKAIKLLCVAELSKRIYTTEASKKLTFLQPDTVANYCMEKFRHLETECICILYLDAKLRLLHEIILSKGSATASLASTREIFLRALKCQAVSILAIHNHPSGDPTPSKQDQLLTQKLVSASELMDIGLIDHLIIGEHCYYSFKEHGKI